MRGLALALVLVASAQAGEAPADRKELAWKAHRAGERGEAEAVPELRRILAGERGATSDESRFVVEAALDALIALRGHVPWDELRPHRKRHPRRVFIALAQHPKKNSAVLRELLAEDGLPFVQWTAVCNLLVAQRAPGLAAHLLGGLEVTLHVHVVNPGEQGGWGLGGCSSAHRGCGRLTVWQGWPPRTYYSLSESEDGVLLAPGVHPVYYRKKVVRSGTGGIGGWVPAGRYDAYRLDYLAALLGVERAEFPLARKHSAQVEWQDARSYERDVLKAHQELQATFRRIAARLEKLELLTRAESAPLTLRIKTAVHDHRESGKPALPALPVR